MKYKWIELYNYAGIYNGMGLTQIKIDFTKCVTNKIIIRGGNGSGKSTIMNAINPNPDSNDNFIPNAEARKIICLSDNGIDYIIRYIHPVTNSGRGTTKGYISKMINGQFVELNTNGNISSCKDIIYSEFNIDSNYLSLSQLSSENRGLVDSKPAERKKLINSIISAMETFNTINKNLSKKALKYKALITTITSKIDYIGNENALNARLSNIDGQLKNLNEEKATTIEAIAAVKIKISEFIKILRDNDYDNIVKELRDLNNSTKAIESKIYRDINAFGIDDINKITDFYEYIKNQYIIIESSIDSSKRELTVLLSQRENEFKELQTKQQRLDSLQSDYNYMDIKSAKQSAEAIVTEYEGIFNKMGLMNINLITKTEFDSAMESLKYLRDSASALTSNFSLELIKMVINDKRECIDKIRSLSEMRKRLNDLKNIKYDLDKEYAIFESKRALTMALDKRPEGCNIDTCPYIESALKADTEYPIYKMQQISSEITDCSEKIKIIESDIELYEILSEILTSVSLIERELDSKMKFIEKLPVGKDFKNTFFYRVINLDRFDDISNLYKFVDCGNMIEEYKVAKEQLRTYEVEYKLYESKNAIIESIIEDITNLTDKTNDLANQIETINNDIRENERELQKLKISKEKINEIIILINSSLEPSKSKILELSEIKSKLDHNTVELEKFQNDLETLNTNNATIDRDISALSNERDNIKHSLILLNDYRNELATYMDKASKIDKIRYYSSTSTGIQTVFMSLYMNNIISVANDLLSLLFKGEFMLQPFVIDESQFRIPCIGSGLMHDDISSMSTAQKCMISMILSFSILHQSATRYNVIKLDEIDGGLDTSNRSYFITLLDKIMGMLRCEQAFIVSHNNELDTSLADIIILKNPSHEIYNGNIIWEY